MEIKKENYFLLKDGTIIRNLFELSKALDKMPEDTFSHHVNESRNDFYNWIKDVVKDSELAKKVLNANSRKQMQKFIGEKIQKDIIKEMKSSPSPKKEAKPKET
ncbi:hypothetical protein GOV06_00235, partial [Candidatus Woesearchaeota archaeon]|nr:hypothetical protein [Candidatus Woesearchaeota archaeon]